MTSSDSDSDVSVKRKDDSEQKEMKEEEVLEKKYLQTGAEFGKMMENRSKDNTMNKLALQYKNGDTVHRDSRGRKVALS